jgi:hypothetical protein
MGKAAGLTRDQQTLEIEPPSVQCGHCRFSSSLKGQWSVEDGRLVFRADADPQPGRGPDLDSCCESSPVVDFEHIAVTDGNWDTRELSAEDVASLREQARIERTGR